MFFSFLGLLLLYLVFLLLYLFVMCVCRISIKRFANFGNDRFRGFSMATGQILGFSIGFRRRPYNTLALPCECVIIIIIIIIITMVLVMRAIIIVNINVFVVRNDLSGGGNLLLGRLGAGCG